jgi:hypothetical protein
MTSLAQLIKNVKRTGDLIVTPRIEQWLIDHPEGIVIDDPEVAEIIMGLFQSKENQDRSRRFGASSRGTCMRSQMFQYLGVPGLATVNASQQNLFNDGTWRHVRWQAMGLLAGVFTHVEVPVTMPLYNLKVSIDAVNVDEGWLFELKGHSAYTKTLEGISERHMKQIHTMMLATGYDICVYVVEDKRSQEWREVVVRKDPEVMREVKQELRELSQCLTDKKMPVIQPECMQKTGDYKKCPWRETCLTLKKWPG